MRTDKFEFKTANSKEKPAIWFRLRNRNVIVEPLGLYDVLWDCNRKHYFSYGVYAQFLILDDGIYGSFQDSSYGNYEFEYSKSIFLESAIQSLNALCCYVIEGKATEYGSFTKYAAIKMKEGLEYLNVPAKYYQILEDDVKIEQFSFKFVEPYVCDTPYEIQIGSKTYESNLTDWSTNFNRIRLEMEKSLLIFHEDMDINLYYEDSPTIIRLRTHSLNRKKRITWVTVISDEFAKVPNVYGRCETRQLFRSLYLGLLSICIRETDWFEYEYDYVSWSDFRLATYNKLQSCVIENYIMGIEEDDCTYMPRQRIINTVEEMMEDYRKLQNKL